MDDYNDTDLDVSEEESNIDSVTDSEYSMDLSAQEQWEESMKQIQGLINFIIFPLIGRILGRKVSKVIWAKVANWYF